jgi:response regulator RpfG family c-di-GMP phosphodiesterase
MGERACTDGGTGGPIRCLVRRVAIGWLALRRRAVLREARCLGDHLEEVVFPESRSARVETVALMVASSGELRLAPESGWAGEALPGTSQVAEALARVGVRTLRLDTQLNSDQVVRAVLAAMHAGAHLAGDRSAASEGLVAAWTGGGLAAGMNRPGGVSRMGAVLRFRRATGELDVEHSFREMVFSLVLDRLLGRFARRGDHRSLLSAAPRLGVLVAVLIALEVSLWFSWPAAAWGFGLVLAGALGVLTTALVLLAASIQHDREHREALLMQTVREVTALSHFPVANPNPVMTFTPSGELVYCNPATRRLMGELGLGLDRIAELLPGDLAGRLERVAREGASETRVEVSRFGRTLTYSLSRVPGESVVLVAGDDITELKRLEGELRRANDTLEQRVNVRTFELLLTRDVTIMSLATLAEARDQETGEHLERTRSYVRALAEALRGNPRFADELDSDEAIELLYRSAPLHDVGKVGIPDAILLKPGKLTEEETATMRRHPVIGGDAMHWAEERLGSNSFLRFARQIAYHHHERWDGSGYPYALAGDEIPVAARLMALADVYDALRSRRRYKEPYDHARAREMIVAQRGRHFDPAVVDAFVEREAEFLRIVEQHADATG